MSDFASAAMLRVLHAGMRRLGLRSPAQQWLEQATVPLDAKQQLVSQVMAQRGAAALIQLGQGLHDLAQDSLMPMLIHPAQPLRMLAAWLRLERYLHSKHRIVQTVKTANCVLHQHITIRAGSAPHPAEDLVVLGVLIALLERTGCKGVEAQLAHGLTVWPARPSPASDELSQAVQHRHTDSWLIFWQQVNERTELLPAPVADTKMSEATMTARLQQSLERLRGESLSLAEAASQLGLSTRTLQRSLSQEGVRYVDVVAMVRAQRASQMLSEPSVALAEIGFSCGYTDQAHFCRDFKRRVGMSPLRYREHALARE
jgi:AraC-like DNA-binding protein